MTVIEFIEKELETSKKYCDSREMMLTSCSFCLGALQYAMTNGEVTYEETTDWWEKIRESFYKDPYGLALE